MMDQDEIDSALHEISCMVEFAHRLMSETVVKASRAILSETDRPATIKPVLSIVRDPA